MFIQQKIQALFYILFILIFLGCNSEAQKNPEKPQPLLEQVVCEEHSEIEEQVNFVFSEFQDPKQPGASVMVIQNGEILLDKGYGLANLETRQATEGNTNYRLASVSKQFTAMCILLLIEDKKIEFTTSLRKIFPDFPAYGQKITVQHLLQHSSGLLDYEGLVPSDQKEQVLDKDVLLMMKKQKNTYFEPGTRYLYSNSGYAVLAMIVEKVSGMSYPRFIKERIFDPLGMSNSLAYRKGDKMKHRAYGHSKSSKGGFRRTDQSSTSAVLGDGGVYTSTQDYFLWDQALYGEELLPQSSMEKAFEEWDGVRVQLPERVYGMGWYVGYSDETKVLWHRGATKGFTNVVVRCPELKLTVLILCNRSGWRDIWPMGFAIAGLYSNHKIKIPIDAWMHSVYLQKGFKASLATYQKLKESADKYLFHPLCLDRLGRKLMKAGKMEYAQQIFILNTKEYPKSWMAQYGLGDCFDKQGQNSEALKYYKKALEFQPKAPTEEEKQSLEKIKKKL